ncbi:hypothetical protein GGQ74_002443 [Desulfobaculum xiamenense]|uniref:DUF4747 family protein n=1 Tax=Desulfobaculum xiamenense TaxID=995050 RepID=A0A846QP30_9BACT|nr:hypothetical protein [Desulfobaculum xiamenense]
MSRLNKLEIAVLNITTHPHSPERYLELFKDAFNLKLPIKYRGPEYLLLGRHWDIENEQPLTGIHGVLFKYIDLDLAGAWLDLTLIEPIKSEDGSPIIPIPEDLKPNCQATPFVFLPDGHRLFFFTFHEQKRFSPALIAKSLSALFNNKSLVEKYGEVSVTAESSDETITQILNIPNLTKLSISVTLPNSDDLSKKKEAALARIKRQNAKRAIQEYSGNKHDGLRPDDETRALMELAKSNGYIKAEGYREQIKVTESTSKHPVLILDRYDPTQNAPLTRLISIAKAHIPRFTGRQ